MASLIDKYSKEELEQIVTHSLSYKEVCEKLGYSTTSGSNNDTIQKRLKYYNIDTSHFTHVNDYKFKEEDVFVENSQVSRSALKRRFIKLVEYKCNVCGISEWNNKPIVLVIDHVNGKNNDNRFENLQLICPNCDSQQKTYRGSNRSENKKRYYCVDCGKEISSKYYKRCNSCESKNRRKEPNMTREKLKSLIRTTSFVKIGKMFNVTDNAIRKWCKTFDLPYRTKDIKKISDSEWETI